MNKNQIGIRLLHRFINLIVSYCIAFSIFAIATVIVVYGKWLYYADIHLLNIPDLANMSESEIKKNYDVLITYLSPFYEGSLQFPTLHMSAEGRIHFVDVKNILVHIQYGMCVTIIVALLGGWYMLRKRQIKFLLNGAILTITIPVILILPIAIDFEKSFILFHKLLFRNDYWQFDSEKDPVINMLPEVFFMHAACGILLLILGGSLLSYCLYRYVKRNFA
ncbi:TIGR01906 family membrane protein [Bacillus cytotoxicus]|uniref:lipoprotein intramolecular transacylase Lit n=1 Tax=Bacillus cereus group sp. BfR-BA-01492 TaxID=2920361 RepID=UPI001F5AEADF|nr:TIGR01906 family membrane protein [Bacillus cereus group sp. BfR-BA-01492]EMA6341952.1 TIGR01906 family membrane protein [Bacillus cytotoxicus]